MTLDARATPETATGDPRIRVIFISTGNAARSPMAEAILRRFGKGRFEVVSAGVCPLAKVGIDATGVESEVTGRIHRFIPAAVAEAA